ncbi:protein SODIUM POTASSIUM ROOT DEFECTIVE 2-like [Rhododendron vialii]|uniref:protein SODIUM POTASSIUM ROOT DEFECTIVE 2-like n=1 Tax=Rhododendron vialii TaxID=182163 RepID=UPI00265FC274|nr:protein SODIUM POTASSIUM ROOT DEFECTIVE 2-like [Rhododendron vialii]
MNMKRRVKMRRGFMCQYPGSAAGCTTGDPLSVIVPRRPDRTLVDRANALALDNSTSAKYARLVESTPQRLGNNAAAKMKLTNSVPMPPVVKRRPGGDHKNTGVVGDRKALQKPAPAVASSADQVFQVVVMRVSLHCQGCAGKVKKHISKMEGVTSFSIDLESKRVTVMGHVSPVGVLESISKVKRAEFWPC